MEIKLEKQRGQWAPIAWGISYGRLMEQYIIARRRELAPKTWDGILRAVTQYANPVIGKVPINQINMNHWHRIQNGMIDREIKTGPLTPISNISHGPSPGPSTKTTTS